jgi:hypothetical protein
MQSDLIVNRFKFLVDVNFLNAQENSIHNNFERVFRFAIFLFCAIQSIVIDPRVMINSFVFFSI